MKVDKEFTYQLISELRVVAVRKIGTERDLLKAAANVMENNIRAYLDLREKTPTYKVEVVCPECGKRSEIGVVGRGEKWK
jgi:hypothetical protein